MKKVNEAFSDYVYGRKINTALIESVILRKRTKILEMKISSDEYIDLEEIESFKDFIKGRFGLNDSKIMIKYTDNVKIRPIEEELKNIVLGMASKYPALKAAVNNSDNQIVGKTINFSFKIPVSGFLNTMGNDK